MRAYWGLRGKRYWRCFSSAVDCSVGITHAMSNRLQPVGGESALGNLLVGTNKREARAY